MMKDLQLTAVFVKAEEGGYVGYLEELKEVITQGETMNETEENLFDALKLFLEPKDKEVKDTKIDTVVRKPFISLHSLL